MDEATSPSSGASTAEADPTEQRPPGVDTEHLRDYRALRRDRYDRKLAGVCGGLARHLDVDPTLVRVVLVVLTLFGGAGLLLYGALWLFVPEHGTESALVPVGESTRNVIVVVTLVVALLIALPSGLDGDGGAFVGLLILAGLVAAVLLTRDSAHRGRAPAASAPQTATTGSGAGTGPEWTASPAGSHPPPPPHGAPPGSPAHGRRPARHGGPLLVGIAMASVALALGLLGVVDATGTSVPDAAYPALALAVVGALLVVGSMFGRPGGLVLIGVLSLLALGATSLVEPRFEGERALVVRPSSADQLEPSYDIPAGSVEIDLRGIGDLEALDGRTLDVDVNAGEIVLIVPEGLTVDLDAEVAAGGEISTPDANRGGWSVELDRTVAGDDSRATIQADLQLGFGSIQVRSE